VTAAVVEPVNAALQEVCSNRIAGVVELVGNASPCNAIVIDHIPGSEIVQ
jgi:hypothetical protein